MSVRLSSPVTMYRPTKSMDAQPGLLCQSANYASQRVTHSLWGLAEPSKIIQFHSLISQVRSLRPTWQSKDYGRLKKTADSLICLHCEWELHYSLPLNSGRLFGYLANRELSKWHCANFWTQDLRDWQLSLPALWTWTLGTQMPCCKEAQVAP